MTIQEAIKALKLDGRIEITGNPRRLAEFFEGLAIAIAALRREASWIPVSERLPADGTRVLATIKHHKWISDYNSNCVPDDEKTVHEEYTETCEAIYFENIGWEYRDMEGDAGCSADYAFVSPEADISSPVDEVLAWMPLPEPYQPVDGKENNSEP